MMADDDQELVEMMNLITQTSNVTLQLMGPLLYDYPFYPTVNGHSNLPQCGYPDLLMYLSDFIQIFKVLRFAVALISPSSSSHSSYNKPIILSEAKMLSISHISGASCMLNSPMSSQHAQHNIENQNQTIPLHLHFFITPADFGLASTPRVLIYI
jgi:hypothetical protein